MDEIGELEEQVARLRREVDDIEAQIEEAKKAGRFKSNPGRHYRYLAYDDWLLYDQLLTVKMRLNIATHQLSWKKIKLDPHRNDEIPL